MMTFGYRCVKTGIFNAKMPFGGKIYVSRETLYITAYFVNAKNLGTVQLV